MVLHESKGRHMGQVVRDAFKFFQIFLKGRRQQEGDARFMGSELLQRLGVVLFQFCEGRLL